MYLIKNSFPAKIKTLFIIKKVFFMVNIYKLEKFLLTTIKSGIFFILFLPVVMNSSYFFPFIVPKNVFFRIAVEIIFFSWLALLHINPIYRPNFKKMNKLVWAVAGFFIVNLVAAIFGIGLYSSFWSNYERMSGLFHFAHLLMFFFVLISVLKNREDWNRFFSFSIFTAVLMSMLGLAQYFEIPFLLQSSGGKRLTGSVGNATFFAAYLLFNLFFLFYFAVKPKRFDLKTFAISFIVFDSYLLIASILSSASAASDWGMLNFLKVPILKEAFEYPRILLPFLILQGLTGLVWYFREKLVYIQGLLIVLIGFLSFMIYNTQTRGVIIGIAIGLGILALFSLFSGADKRIKIASIAAIAFIILSPFALLAGKNTSLVKNNATLNRLATISLTDITTESRFLVWEASWKGIKESPKSFLIGYGPENYFYVFNKYFPVGLYKDEGSRIWFDRAHNIIFDVAVTSGVLGLLVYLSIFGYAAWLLLKRFKVSRAMSSTILFVSLLVAYFVQNIFVFDTINTEILFYLVLGFIVFVTSPTEGEEQEEPQYAASLNYPYLATVVLVLLFGIFAINVRTLKANLLLVEGLTNPNGLSGLERLDILQESVDKSLTGRFEARQQMSNLGVSLLKAQDITPQIAKDIVAKVEPELIKSTQEEPHNIRLFLVLTAFYESAQRFDRSLSLKIINVLNDNLYLSKDRPQIYFQIGQAYAFLGNNEKAYENFQKAVDLAPTVIDANVNLMILYVVTEKYDLAKAQFDNIESIGFKELLPEKQVNYLVRIVDAYSRVKAWEEMAYYQEWLTSLEEVPINYSKLAAIYAKLGDNEKAKLYTQKAVELDSNFADEAALFLQQLEEGLLLDSNE